MIILWEAALIIFFHHSEVISATMSSPLYSISLFPKLSFYIKEESSVFPKTFFMPELYLYWVLRSITGIVDPSDLISYQKAVTLEKRKYFLLNWFSSSWSSSYSFYSSTNVETILFSYHFDFSYLKVNFLKMFELDSSFDLIFFWILFYSFSRTLDAKIQPS